MHLLVLHHQAKIQQQLINVLVVVTRYFGGVLLGTGGLVRAYTEAAKQGLKNAEIKALIENASTIEEVEAIEISYELPVEESEADVAL